MSCQDRTVSPHTTEMLLICTFIMRGFYLKAVLCQDSELLWYIERSGRLMLIKTLLVQILNWADHSSFILRLLCSKLTYLWENIKARPIRC